MNFIAKHIQALGLLALTAFAATAATLYLGLPMHSARQTVTQPAAKYSCPMHPKVVSNHPGDCSICGMALVESGTASKHPADCGHAMAASDASHAGCDHTESSGSGCCAAKPKPATNSIPAGSCTRSLYPDAVITPH